MTALNAQITSDLNALLKTPFGEQWLRQHKRIGERNGH